MIDPQPVGRSGVLDRWQEGFAKVVNDGILVNRGQRRSQLPRAAKLIFRAEPTQRILRRVDGDAVHIPWNHRRMLYA